MENKAIYKGICGHTPFSAYIRITLMQPYSFGDFDDNHGYNGGKGGLTSTDTPL